MIYIYTYIKLQFSKISGACQTRHSTSFSRYGMAAFVFGPRFQRQSQICRLHETSIGMRKSHPKGHRPNLSRTRFFQEKRRRGSRSPVQCDEGLFHSRSRSRLLPRFGLYCWPSTDADARRRNLCRPGQIDARLPDARNVQAFDGRAWPLYVSIRSPGARTHCRPLWTFSVAVHPHQSVCQ